MHDPLTIAPQEKDTILVQGITRTEDEPGITRLQDGRHTPPAMTETAKSETRVGTPEESKNILAHATDPTEIELPLQPSKEVPALEKLPPELRRYLLSTVELDSLQSLIEASPIYYQQYKLDREQLLCRSLESTLGSAAVDAYYVYQSNTVEFSKHRTPDRIDELLKSYRDRMSQPWCEVLGIKDVVSMIKFYSKIIQPLLRHYKSQALNRLAEETKSPKINEDLSRTEEIRLMRAFYRYQLCCNIYGLGRGKPFRFDEGFRFDEVYCCDDTWAFHTGYVTSARLLGDFFCIFDPWEAEELACITKFVQEKYEAIFDKIQWDLNDKNPKFDGQRPSTPDGAFDLRNFGELFISFFCIHRTTYSVLIFIKIHSA